ncbi:MAG: hypothetical protein PHO56_00945 [Patescibacteria group bacterium]|nr:hypothetical protein [Patescibacteria group bacterium]
MERNAMSQEQTMTLHEKHDAGKKEAFAEQQRIMDKIKTIGFARYAENLPRLAEAFDLKKHQLDDFENCVCCMDERTPYGVHSAGSGILLSEADFATYMKVVQPDAISSHDGCGAGKLYCRAHGLPEENSDQIARDWAEQMAVKFDLPHRHITAEEMGRKFHDARVCYWDATGRINNDPDSGLPEGFVISRAYMNKENCLNEVRAALDIIFGDHGFGKEFLTVENPFVIAAVAWDEQQLAEMQQELAELKHSYGDRVSFDAFIPPLTE